MSGSAADFPEGRWRGHWVWVPEEPISMGSPFAWDRAPRPEAHGLFRRAFHLQAVPGRVPARIAADSRYVLWVNGVRLGFGPARSQPRRMGCDTYDLAPWLVAGRNVIAVQVKYYGRATSDWAPAVANATLGKTGILVFEADLGPGGWLVSDGDWAARAGRGWLQDAQDPDVPVILAGVPTESFDARREAADWAAPGHDDADWGRAQVIVPVHIGGRGTSQPPSDPYGPLIPRGAAMPGGALCRPVAGFVQALDGADFGKPGPAARIEAAALGRGLGAAATLPVALGKGLHLLALEFGRIVAGFVEFEIEAEAGVVIDLHFTEAPITRPGPFGAHGGARYVTRAGRQSHRIFDRKGLRWAWLLVQGPLVLREFRVQEDLYPWAGGAYFDGSDAGLVRLYTAGRRTVALNSWDAFIDCPTREQRSWTGDSVVHQMVHLATNEDWRLVARHLELANSPRPDGILPMSVGGDVEAGEGFTIPDWSLHWLHGVWLWHLWAGEPDRVRGWMATAERVLRWYLPYLNRAGRLQDVPEWNLVDWSALYSEGESAIVTGLWARGLREFAELAEWLGDAGRAGWARGLWARVQAGFEIYWDEGRGLYVDHALGGVAQPQANQLAGALAIVSGLAPQARWGRIVQGITDPARLVVRSWMFPGPGAPPEEGGQRFRRMILGGLVPDWDVAGQIVMAEPFMSYVVHDAVAAAGRADLLPGLLRKWEDFLTDGYDTFGENWGTGTRVHGWSSTPTRDIAWHVLGVTPAAPGFARARVAPRPGAMTWMAGEVPTPAGPLRMAWKAGRLRLDSPVPVTLDLGGGDLRDLPQGRHEMAWPG